MEKRVNKTRYFRTCRRCYVALLIVCTVSLLLSVMYVHRGSSRHMSETFIRYAFGSNRDATNKVSAALAASEGETTSYDELQPEYLKRLADLTIVNKNIGNSTICRGDYRLRGPCLNESCTDTFLPPKQRLRKIIRWRYPIAEQYLTSFIKMANQTQRADIIFLTAASDNHFLESQGLLADLYQKVFPFLRNNTRFTFRLVYYDLGLTEPQVLVLKKYCNCSVIPFPFDEFPETFRQLRACLWKPIVVKAQLPLSSFVIWMDASTRYRNPDITPMLQQASALGVSLSRTYWMLAQHVAEPMLRYFQVDPCLLSPFYELASGYLIFKRDELTERAIVDSWVACALSPTCLCSETGCQRTSCGIHITKIYSRCHRFDQTALALILVNLFDYRVSSLVADRFQNMVLFQRGNSVHFFPEER